MSNPLTLVWLRRDLRLHDHAALSYALSLEGDVQPVFVFDTDILARFTRKDDPRLSFLADSLAQLDAGLRERGGRLLVLHGNAGDEIPRLAKQLHAQHIVAGADFEPGTLARDKHVAKHAPLTRVKDHLIFTPNEILKDDGSPYKVFTPYARTWREKLTTLDYAPFPVHDKGRYAKVDVAGLDACDPKKMLAQIGYDYAPLAEWPVEGAQARLKQFIKSKSSVYPTARNFMGEAGTSRLSPYFRFGLVSIREALTLALEAGGADVWIKELIWREFYAMILAHWPDSAHSEWNPAYRERLRWSENRAHFDAWREGRTGYPVVDAAMHELLHTGWMHNRARMIVASFLTKHLRIDWRWGEEHFAQYLMDYEMASNVGGWQWAASTGTDAQPYFRVFNPVLQSRKFDPHGDYIRRYVPELRGMDDKAIHEPWNYLQPAGYPAPIVDHAKARAAAIAMFKE